MNALSPSRTRSRHSATISVRASSLVAWPWIRPCRDEEPERLGDVAVAEFGERFAFDGVAVAAVLGQVDRVRTVGRGRRTRRRPRSPVTGGGHRPGRPWRAPYRRGRGAGRGCGCRPWRLRRRPRPCRSRPVHGFAVEGAEEPFQAARRDPGARLELGGGAGGERASHDRVPVAFPCLAGDGQGVGLAGPGRTDHHRHAGPVGRQRGRPSRPARHSTAGSAGTVSRFVHTP